MKLMDARKVNASSVSRYSLAGPFKGHMSFKSSPYCPGSSNKLTSQYIIEDHMLSHYKKVFSAKAAVDSTVPKSLLSSVKYCDQQKRERLKRDATQNERRAHSVQSLSQRSVRTETRPSSTEAIQSRESVLRGQHVSPGLESPMMSTLRFKQGIYPSSMEHLWGTPHRRRCASELGYGRPDSRRQLSARSCFTSGSHGGLRSFQNPAQKTYCGDLLQKHSHRFTGDKPFTPRTLKTESRSFLSGYRFYTPPRVRQRDPELTHRDSFCKSTHSLEGSTEEEWDLHHHIVSEPEWSDEESQSLNHSDFAYHIREQKSRRVGYDPLSSPRVSPDGLKSPVMKKVSEEEEELKYLEFIADVTNDVLSRGLYSERVLERVFARQIEMNKHRLDKDKMRHLLEVLRKDLASPSDSVTNCVELEGRGGSYQPTGLLSSLGKDSDIKTKENGSIIACAVLDKDSTETQLPDSESNKESVLDSLVQSNEIEELERDLTVSLCLSGDINDGLDKHKEADGTEDFFSDDML
ncbi:hypothetical protein GJAV_G00010660 [Gymnothorax javanicus]|nr:hypothetical protein GJAV_G00010660 [Gymnothorax javanicus]